jgi:hypothetical protein
LAGNHNPESVIGHVSNYVWDNYSGVHKRRVLEIAGV